MRIGIYGGTFDPIHHGHLALAEQCREQCGLDQVWFVPAAQPPHKLNSPISSAAARRDMVEFAIAGNQAFRLCTVELERSGPSFTVTTLQQLQAANPDDELFLLIGADSLRDLPHWREPKQILDLATIVAVNRGDRPLPDRSALRSLCGPTADTRILTVAMPGIDLSSTDIRDRVSKHKTIRYFVPRAVEMYIAEQRLYRDAGP